MHCLILFRDSAGRLPTAQELRRCGFEVSGAALPPADSTPVPAPLPATRPELALAAEPAAPYGDKHNHAAHPEPFHAEQPRHARPEPCAQEPCAPEQPRPPVAGPIAADGGA